MTASSVTDSGRLVAEGLLSVSPPALIGGRCPHCDALIFPRRELCPECQRGDVAAVALSDTGTVYTFTIVRMSPPGYLGDSPYAYGVVELPEGLRVTSTLVADELEQIAIGDRCTFELLELGAGDERTVSFAYRIGGAE